MTEPYTPSLDEARDAYADGIFPALSVDQAYAAYDRLIAQVREEAWDEGWDASERFGYPADPLETYENPYRASRIEQGENDV